MTASTVRRKLAEALAQATQERLDMVQELISKPLVDYAWQTLPSIAKAELRAKLYHELIEPLDRLIKEHGDTNAAIQSWAALVTEQIEHEQDAALRYMEIPSSTNQIANALEGIKYEYRPQRWLVMREWAEIALATNQE